MSSPVREGIFGGGISLGFSLASIPLERVNAVLTLVSLALGIAVAVVTLYRWTKNKDMQELLDKVAQNERGLGRVELQLFVLSQQFSSLGCQKTGECSISHTKQPE